MKKKKAKRSRSAAHEMLAGSDATHTKKPRPEQKRDKEERQKPERDIVEVREDIHRLVKNSATQIAEKVIAVTVNTGQLASAKYLFEAAGVYPPTEETTAKPRGDPLAEALLKRMGLPTEPMIGEEDAEPLMQTGVATKTEDAMAKLAEEDSESIDELEREPCGAKGIDRRASS